MFEITRRGNGWLSMGNVRVRVYDSCLDDELRLSPALLRLTRHFDENRRCDGFSAEGTVELMDLKGDFVVARHDVAFDCLYDPLNSRFSITGNYDHIATEVDGLWKLEPPWP